MKKLFSIASGLVIVLTLSAQSHVDALRYSQHTIGGTARSVAMGGAFGALGGDFSTLSSNPAGLGVYRSSEFTFTPEFYLNQTNARYFGTEREENKFNFNLSNLGYVAHFESDGALKAANFGIGFNRIANFHREEVINGVNPNTSLGDYMAALGNDPFPAESNLIFKTWMFNDAGVILYNEPLNEYHLRDSADGYFYEGSFIPTEQRVITSESGKINEWTFSLGLNFGHVLYFGGTFGIHSVYFNSTKNWKEFDADFPDFQYFDFTEKLTTRGTGYTGKFGVILRPISLVRVGAAINLPVTYKLKDEYTTSISSAYITGTYYPVDANGRDVDALESEYTVVSPLKLIGSAALVLGKFLVVSSDIEYINYASMRMKPSDDFDFENENIQEIYDATINAKLGTEFRLGKTYYRGGFGYYGSPYAETEENHDSFQLSFSGGFGIRDENFFFDIAYQYVNFDYRQYQYGVSIGGVNYNPVANIDTKNHRVMTTIGFRF